MLATPWEQRPLAAPQKKVGPAMGHSPRSAGVSVQLGQVPSGGRRVVGEASGQSFSGDAPFCRWARTPGAQVMAHLHLRL